MSVFLNAAQVMSNDDSNDILKQIVVSLGGLYVEIMDGVATPKLRAGGRMVKANVKPIKPIQAEDVGESRLRVSIVCLLTFASTLPRATGYIKLWLHEQGRWH